MAGRTGACGCATLIVDSSYRHTQCVRSGTLDRSDNRFMGGIFPRNEHAICLSSDFPIESATGGLILP